MSASTIADWHLVCITRLGRVSILKNLDRDLALETYRRIMPNERPRKYLLPDCKCSSFIPCGVGRTYGATDDWIERVEAIGPQGASFLPWEGVTPQNVDLTYQCQCAKPAAPEAKVAMTAFEEVALREAGSL